MWVCEVAIRDKSRSGTRKSLYCVGVLASAIRRGGRLKVAARSIGTPPEALSYRPVVELRRRRAPLIESSLTLLVFCLSFILSASALRPLLARYRLAQSSHMSSAGAFIPLPPAREIPSSFVASVKSW